MIEALIHPVMAARGMRRLKEDIDEAREDGRMGDRFPQLEGEIPRAGQRSWADKQADAHELEIGSPMVDVILKRFEAPDEVRQMTKGRFELVHIGGLTIGRATYEPGWRWSSHVGPGVGATHCTVEHVGLVLAGTATAAFADGRVVELRAGELFHIPAEPHDSWVVGDEPYVSLHFLGADHYAK